MKFLKFFKRTVTYYVCVYGYVCINDTWQMVTLYHRSHKSLTLSVAPKYVSRFCEFSKKFKLRQEKELCKSDDMKVFFHYKNCLIEIKDTNSAGQMEVNKKIETFETAKKEKC